MDIATILRVVSGTALVLTAIIKGSGLSLFIDIPSVMIVCGGLLAATLISYPFKEVFGVFKLVSKTFFVKTMTPEQIIVEFIKLAGIAQKEGLLKLADHVKTIKDEFFKDSMSMMVNQTTDPGSMVKILKGRVTTMEQRHKTGRDTLGDMGKYGPAFGMVGTLIGLVQMLSSLEDPSTIGPKMAVALLTTFYGAFLANMFFIPMSVKLKRRSEIESLSQKTLIEGIQAFQGGDSTRIIELKMKTFVSDETRKKLTKNKKGGAAAAK